MPAAVSVLLSETVPSAGGANFRNDCTKTTGVGPLTIEQELKSKIGLLFVLLKQFINTRFYQSYEKKRSSLQPNAKRACKKAKREHDLFGSKALESIEKNGNLDGYDFDRQRPIGNYIDSHFFQLFLPSHVFPFCFHFVMCYSIDLYC